MSHPSSARGDIERIDRLISRVYTLASACDSAAENATDLGAAMAFQLMADSLYAALASNTPPMLSAGGQYDFLHGE